MNCPHTRQNSRGHVFTYTQTHRHTSTHKQLACTSFWCSESFSFLPKAAKPAAMAPIVTPLTRIERQRKVHGHEYAMGRFFVSCFLFKGAVQPITNFFQRTSKWN